MEELYICSYVRSKGRKSAGHMFQAPITPMNELTLLPLINFTPLTIL